MGGIQIQEMSITGEILKTFRQPLTYLVGRPISKGGGWVLTCLARLFVKEHRWLGTDLEWAGSLHLGIQSQLTIGGYLARGPPPISSKRAGHPFSHRLEGLALAWI